MSHAASPPASPLIRGFKLLQEYAAFLLAGTALALIWANVNYESYHHFVDGQIGGLEGLKPYLVHGEGNLNLHFLVNDLFMVLFFGIAMKEVSESFLPGGALSSMRKAAMPAIATFGGVVGPVAVFFALRALLQPEPDIFNAWAVPTATDIAYCWLFASMIFGRAHPAVTFLLVLAVLDDLIGMFIIAVFYTAEVHLAWLGLVILAIAVCETMRRLGVRSFWPYLLIGAPLSWIGLHNTGVHAALALVPVVPFMPHAERDAGLFKQAGHGDDTMNHFEHFFKPIVDVGLFTFGLANAGVVLSGDAVTGSAMWIILLSLLVGKTAGIFLMCFIGTKAGLTLPSPLKLPQTIVLGCVAGIGFTVALFVTSVALKMDAELLQIYRAAGTEDMLKLGALLSFAAGPIAFLLAKAFRVKRMV